MASNVAEALHSLPTFITRSSAAQVPMMAEHHPESHSSPNKKPTVVGLYGLSGCGKTFLLNQLKQDLGVENFAFFDGSQVIETVVPGGLDSFKKLGQTEKENFRRIAIQSISKECLDNKKVGVVAGHFALWSEATETAQVICTQADLSTYTHIIYLNVPPETIHQQRDLDTTRSRPSVSVRDLKQWQTTEIIKLKELCLQTKILFYLESSACRPSSKRTRQNVILALMNDIKEHTEEANMCRVRASLDEILHPRGDQLETVLVLDADKTLAATDTGELFWEHPFDGIPCKDVLKKLFTSKFEYSYNAFRQATFLYEEYTDEDFETLCGNIAAKASVHPEFVSLLRIAAKTDHARAVVVTCGLRRVWEKVLQMAGLSDNVKVIGGGRIADGYVVTPEVKAALVHHLRDVHRVYVWAFGDSPMDLPMLKAADQAIVVVCEQQTRSKSMDPELWREIEKGGFQPRQALLPRDSPPRLSPDKLPRVHIEDIAFLETVFIKAGQIQLHHATDRNAAKVLMTPMRDANISGPALREAHRRAGWYLATEILADLIGVEEYRIPHVQDRQTDGYRLSGEDKTSIIALMRGGEPMALGVNDAFPGAAFIHAKDSNDVKTRHLEGQETIILVDSVVNSGKTVVEFVRRIRNLQGAIVGPHPVIRIVVVAGVVQADCLSQGQCARELARDANVSLVALRLSDNKFTGRGTTDTGNRLFNTTRIP